MPVDDARDAAAPRERLTGWGRTAPSVARVHHPTDLRALGPLLASGPPRGVAARGLGRSYGDAAQLAGGDVIDTTADDRIVSFNPATGVLRAAAGLSIDALLRTTVPAGWFVPVTPGTRYVTLGGAVAADIHGKNHHRDGSFARHVRSLGVLLADGTHVEVGPDRDAELFWATAGGMGLTGLITEVELTLRPIETALMSVDTERARDLDDLLARLEEGDERCTYSVAWLDCTAPAAVLGRGVLTRGEHAPRLALPPAKRADPLAYDPKVRVSAPFTAPPRTLNRLTVRAFNEVWYRTAPARRRGQLQTIPRFFHPLDGVGAWNRLYGPDGFVQYQYVVPFDAVEAVRRSVELLSRPPAAAFLAVLKRFGQGTPGPLSFPRPGWTLALDLPVVDGLAGLLDRLDELVLEAGGRLYLAKDARTSPALVPRMYPDLDRFRAVRARVDPTGTFATDLSRRLEL